MVNRGELEKRMITYIDIFDIIRFLEAVSDHALSVSYMKEG